MIEQATRVEKNEREGYEVWAALVDGQPVIATVQYGEFRRVERDSWGRMSFRAYVEARLAAEGNGEMAA